MILAKTLLFTLLVPGTMVGALPYWVASVDRSPMALGNARWLGVLPLLLGVFIYALCAFDFSVTGRGTPFPLDPPRFFVARGLYRYVRNPMYVGVLLAFLGQALLYESDAIFLCAAAVWAGFHGVVLLYEEPILAKRFGETYRAYRARVPRWIPRLKSRTA